MTKESGQGMLSTALQAVSSTFDRGQAACDDWKGPATPVPTANITYQEACHIVQRREDEKRKRDSKHDKSKKKTSGDDAHVPGSRPGIDPDVNAFWMVAEVCAQLWPSTRCP